MRTILILLPLLLAVTSCANVAQRIAYGSQSVTQATQTVNQTIQAAEQVAQTAKTVQRTTGQVNQAQKQAKRERLTDKYEALQRQETQQEQAEEPQTEFTHISMQNTPQTTPVEREQYVDSLLSYISRLNATVHSQSATISTQNAHISTYKLNQQRYSYLLDSLKTVVSRQKEENDGLREDLLRYMRQESNQSVSTQSSPNSSGGYIYRQPSTTPRRSYTPRSQQVYHLGPRGGCYYYTSSGRKEYVDRSLCH